MLSFIKLLRPANLLIIALTMYAVRWGIIHSFIDGQHVGMEFKFEEWKFFLSVLVMVFLAASGNIINDYFDIRVDRINKPDQVLVGKKVKRRVAMIGHQIFNVLAFGITLFLVWDFQRPREFPVYWEPGWPYLILLLLIPASISLALWFYSLRFKKEFFSGNLIVALLVAIVPVWAALFEIPLNSAFYSAFVDEAAEFYTRIWQTILLLALFAFLLTLIREALKDMEDLEGDRKVGYRTIPIVWGLKWTRTYSAVLGFFTTMIVGTIALRLHRLEWVNSSFYWLFGLLATALLTSSILILRSRDKGGYSLASLSLKITMVIGVILAWSIGYWLVLN